MGYGDEHRDSTGPFVHYVASAATVDEAADGILVHAGSIEALDSDVVGAHRTAQSGVAGLLDGPMRTAPAPVVAGLWDTVRSIVFASGAIRSWGHAIRAYDLGIDDLNRRYRAAQSDSFGVTFSLPADATSEQRDAALDTYRADVAAADRASMAALTAERDNRLVPDLDTAAAGVAGLLDRGPDDAEAVLWMYQSGALPLSAPAVFTAVDFTDIDAYQLFTNLIRTGQLPASLTTMDEDELFEWFKDHPTHADGVGVLLLLPPVMTPEWRRMLNALGRYDAWRVQRALDRDADQTGLDRLGLGVERLEEINARLAAGGQMTIAEREYLFAWFNALGAENLRDLPGYAEDSPMHLRPIGDAIRNLADPGVSGITDPLRLPQGLLDAFSDPVRVFNLNAGEGYENMSWDPTEGTDGRDMDDLARIILGTDADVVTLQEIFEGDLGRLKTYLELATGDEWQVHFGAAMHKYQTGEIPFWDGGFDAFGNAVLVRTGHGIDNTNDLDEVTLAEPGAFGAFGGGGEGRSMKGAEIVTSNGGTLHVYTTHVASNEGQDARAEQIGQVGQVAEDATGPVAVFGDFNAVPGESGPDGAALEAMEDEHGLTDSVRVGPTASNGTGEQIDRAYTRGVLVGDSEIVDGGPSDHHGFVVDMRIPTRPLDEFAARFGG
jgi:endonuclease/exonuclease/phosphatase family metal-dependent hydrolase